VRSVLTSSALGALMSGEGAKVDHPAQVTDILGRWAQAAQRGEPIEKVLNPAEIAILKEAAPKIAAAVQQRGSAIFQDPAAFQSRVRQALTNPDGAPSPADANPGGGSSTTAAQESATDRPARPPSARPPSPPTAPPTTNEEPSLIPGLESETSPPTAPTIPGLPQSDGWGEVGPQHIGQQVETRDGLTGTLRDVGQRNVAFKDATGKAYAVPIADTRPVQGDASAPHPPSTLADASSSPPEPLLANGGTGPSAPDATTVRKGVEAKSMGPGGANRFDEAFAENRSYTGSSKHADKTYSVGGEIVNPAPTNGQAALDFSFPVSADSMRRIGIDLATHEIVVLDRTGNIVRNGQIVGGEYHGHLRSYDQLTQRMKAILRANKINVGKRGAIRVDSEAFSE